MSPLEPSLPEDYPRKAVCKQYERNEVALTAACIRAGAGIGRCGGARPECYFDLDRPKR